MYFMEIKPKFKKNVRKIKNFEDKKAVFNKMQEIANTLEFNPNHYKNLRKPMQKCKRVHINTNFVMVFEVDNLNKKVIFYNYLHHDKIYK